MRKSKEIWKDIQGFEGVYKISNRGNVKKKERRSIYNKRTFPLRKTQTPQGYLTVSLNSPDQNKKVTKLVHRLVAQHFIPNPDDLPEVNHIDSNKKNNRVENLEWCTNEQNLKHYQETRLYNRNTSLNRKRKPNKLSVNEVELIRERYRNGETNKTQLGKDFKVHRTTITKIINKTIWNYQSEE